LENLFLMTQKKLVIGLKWTIDTWKIL
jgi:hypothetical protein